ncbi:MAG: hypothetical protein QT05_C0016G0005 [archaeon GW2011_AR13]|nr:MAG: hypothetical protein QT05_C0016G0005 [archaeon GW2011_AR13]HIG95079.1 hypothetical protein [Nanoarchaeota archaeon]HIH63268.1 hypothetical protein [Nanoarchaeota archaeon]HIJ09264.1 hypothetical protein [Nanoarchaeota archaeon]
MEIDRQILNDYFTGKEICQEDFESIKRYREYCIQQANQPGLTRPYTNYSGNFDLMKKLYPEVSRENLKGKKIIEIGTGANPLAKDFLEMGVTEYTGLEPFHPELSRENLKECQNAKIVEEDGLSYLLKQDDESSLVTSYGIICPEISRMNNNDYFKFLIKEIYRVTPKNGITMHVHGFEKEKAINLFGSSGFKPLGDWILQFVWKK